jgi:endonuclease/exonuclease/phosphatase family metal-dependent hydrolase
VLSRWPLAAVRPADFAGDGLPSLVVQLGIDGRNLMVLGLHTRWPLLPRLATARDVALYEAANMMRGQGLATVALGDLNATPYSPVYERFLGNAGLRDAMDGRGWQPTWRAGFWPLALRIDHVLVSPDLCVEHAEVGPAVGSDHRPVIARLRFSAAERP